MECILERLTTTRFPRNYRDDENSSAEFLNKQPYFLDSRLTLDRLQTYIISSCASSRMGVGPHQCTIESRKNQSNSVIEWDCDNTGGDPNASRISVRRWGSTRRTKEEEEKEGSVQYFQTDQTIQNENRGQGETPICWFETDYQVTCIRVCKTPSTHRK